MAIPNGLSKKIPPAFLWGLSLSLPFAKGEIKRGYLEHQFSQNALNI
jgi:hypothetical protein